MAKNNKKGSNKKTTTYSKKKTVASSNSVSSVDNIDEDEIDLDESNVELLKSELLLAIPTMDEDFFNANLDQKGAAYSALVAIQKCSDDKTLNHVEVMFAEMKKHYPHYLTPEILRKNPRRDTLLNVCWKILGTPN